ncbi:Pr6Pr family membrane protein [Arabiibacter massiliensis]|uniref:Pr6Pr family membrane protein n=1 Tax=Arabiibacter massiliensis TaxID=1870985 RepID=UPI0009BAC7A9|nr:Pr6Pr family membrane protein [Arabiibacter massiliensis]
MRIRNRTASIAFKCLIVVVGGLALLEQLGLFAGAFKPRFFFYFTNLSNVAAVAYFAAALVHLARNRGDDAVWAPAFKYAAMMAVTVTWLVAHFLLGGGLIMPDGTFSFSVLALHYLVPIACILDWLLFDEKGRMSLAGPLVWMAFPLAYLAYALGMVGLLGVNMGPKAGSRYPYPFIDVDANGVGGVAVTVVALVAAFIALGYAYVALDRLLARVGRKRTLSS